MTQRDDDSHLRLCLSQSLHVPYHSIQIAEREDYYDGYTTFIVINSNDNHTLYDVLHHLNKPSIHISFIQLISQSLEIRYYTKKRTQSPD